MIGFPSKPPPSETEILEAVPVKTLVVILPLDTLVTRPLLASEANDARSASYACAEDHSTVPLRL